MLKEQLLGIAIKTLSQAYDAKERIKKNFKSEAIRNYFHNVRNNAISVVENQLKKFRRDQEAKAPSYDSTSKSFQSKDSSSRSAEHQKGLRPKKRRSSIKPAKEIGSTRADVIVTMLKNDGSRLVRKSDLIDGKTSLAYLVWALGHAERAHLREGISVHDVSALLYRACDIELYPINISRVVYGNKDLVRQVKQQNRTKTYLLTAQGENLFKKNFL